MRVLATLVVGWVFLGCTPNTDVIPSGLSVSALDLDFGVVPLTTSNTLTVTLSNPGSLPIDVLSVSLANGATSVWDVDRGEITSIVNGEDAEIAVTFEPDEEIAYVGRVQVRTTDELLDSFLIALSGSGGPSAADDDDDGVTPADGDCDDSDPTVHAGAAEICDGRDNDCDGVVPADEADDDFDGVRLCGGDCDDDDSRVYPGAEEICDGKDSDCAGGQNDFADLDGDGHAVCVSQSDLTLDDCDDGEPLAYVGGIEVCGDGVDNDCNAQIDDVDVDGDGHSPCSSSGDCDDTNPLAFPVVVSPTGSAAGAGTDADPYDTLSTAVANLDAVCHQVLVQPGTYTVAETVDSLVLEILGAGSTPGDVVLEAAQDRRHFLVRNGAELTLDSLTLRSGNPVSGGSNVDGGAILVDAAVLVARDVAFSDNSSTTDGGALAAQSDAEVTLVDCLFAGNDAGDDGGAWSATASTVDDSGGSYLSNGAGAFGGAISAEGGEVSVTDGELVGNVAGNDGGAVSLGGAGVYRLERLDVWLNTATSGGGGVDLDAIGGASGTVRNNRFQNNGALGAQGGGLRLTGDSAGSSLEIVNNTFVGEAVAAGVDGAALYLAGSNASGVRVWSNLAFDCDGGTGLHLAGSGADVQYNTVRLTNTNVNFAGDVSSGTGGNNEDDPGFLAYSSDGDPTNDDLRLASSSPVLDAGAPDAEYDDKDGSSNDRGAYGGPGAP